IAINFTATQSTVVLAWGGHIADHRYWMPGTSAANITGSPFHTRLVGLDGSGGNQDRALASDAVTFPASVTIVKSAIPSPNATKFDFTTTLSPSTFSLWDDGTVPSDPTPNSILFSKITTFQSYTVTEAVPTGWIATPGIVCSAANPNGGTYTAT